MNRGKTKLLTSHLPTLVNPQQVLTCSRPPQQELVQLRLLAVLHLAATPANRPACHPLRAPALRPGQGLFLQTRA